VASRRRAILGNAALLCGSTVAILLVLELGVRVLHPQPLAAVARSPRLGWTHKPNADIVYERSEFRIPVHFSSAGLRDGEYAFAKPAATARLVYLGDSFVEAVQVPFDSCAEERLEAQLRRQPPDARRWEVLNFGVSGYGTCQQLLLLEEQALRFEPDVVLAQLYFNDLDDDRRFGLCDLDAGGGLRVAPATQLGWKQAAISNTKSFLYQHSHLYMFVSTRKPRTVRPAGGGAAPESKPAGAAPMHDVAPPPPPATPDAAQWSPVQSCPGRHTSHEWRMTLRELPDDTRRAIDQNAATWERMQAASRAHGARFAAILGVSKTQLEPAIYARTLIELGCDPRAHDVDLPPSRLAAAAAARGVEVFDLLPAFRSAVAREAVHFRYDGHWNAAGHRIAARALYDALVARGTLVAGQSSEVHP
jgi:lysophospholipase L1-like esterase